MMLPWLWWKPKPTPTPPGEMGHWLDTVEPVRLSDMDGSFRISDRPGYENMRLFLMRATSDINAKRIKRRGTLVFTTDDKRFHIHDGVTPGGALHFKEVNDD